MNSLLLNERALNSYYIDSMIQLNSSIRSTELNKKELQKKLFELNDQLEAKMDQIQTSQLAFKTKEVQLLKLQLKIEKVEAVKDSMSIALIVSKSKVDSLIKENNRLFDNIKSLQINQSETNNRFNSDDLVEIYTESKNDQILLKENNWELIQKNLQLNENEKGDIVLWLQDIEDIVFDDDADMFTAECFQYTYDAIDRYWGYPGSIEEDEFRSKWASKFDLRYAGFSQKFENGNGGWGSKKIEKCDYLGELNGGNWYKLTIIGGGENDYSQKIIRVVKVIRENGYFKISNFLSLKD